MNKREKSEAIFTVKPHNIKIKGDSYIITCNGETEKVKVAEIDQILDAIIYKKWKEEGLISRLQDEMGWLNEDDVLHSEHHAKNDGEPCSHCDHNRKLATAELIANITTPFDSFFMAPRDNIHLFGDYMLQRPKNQTGVGDCIIGTDVDDFVMDNFDDYSYYDSDSDEEPYFTDDSGCEDEPQVPLFFIAFQDNEMARNHALPKHRTIRKRRGGHTK